MEPGHPTETAALVYRVKPAGHTGSTRYFRSADRALAQLADLLRRRIVGEYSVRAILAGALPDETPFADSLTQPAELILRRPKAGCKQRSAHA